MPRSILFSVRNRIGILGLNRPDVLNAINRDLYRALSRQLDRIEKHKGVRVLVVTGRGRAFCAGTDIADLRGVSPEEAEEIAWLENRTLDQLEALPQPSIAAVHGYALGGGCELAMACDLRIAADDAVFGQPEVGLGWIPAAGATFRLPRLVGTARAKALIFSTERIGAAEAERIGLVNRVVPAEDLMDEAVEWAKSLAEKDPTVMRYAKQALSPTVDRGAAQAIEAEALGKCATSPYAQGNIERFFSKREQKGAGR